MRSSLNHALRPLGRETGLHRKIWRGGDRAIVVEASVNNAADVPSLTFGRTRRLTRPAEFSRVRIDGKAQRGTILILGVLETGEAAVFRAGFVTSKRVGGAVVRNRVRRRLRDIVRRHQGEVRAGIWLVSIARPAAARATHAALEDEWLRLAKRAFILAP